MKKLILSLAALAFATFLFSQDDSNDASEVNQNSVVKVQNKLENDSQLRF